MTTTTSKYTERVGEVMALLEVEGDASSVAINRELLDLIATKRGLVNCLLAEDQSIEAKRLAKRERLWATNSEKLVVNLYDFSHGLGEWAPGGKYATPEYLAWRAASKMRDMTRTCGCTI
jgi:hypothetical protein